MGLLSKLKETLISVLPIMAVVLILNFTIAPLGDSLFSFLLGGLLLVLGLTLFLSGTDIGMVPIGQRLGSVLAQKRNLPLMLTIGFLIGFGVTFAEPDVNVLASQVHSINPAINQRALVMFIAVGLGIFVDIGLLRAFKCISLRFILIVFYLAVFAVIGFAGQEMASISFDASGATTGPLAVPFLLALGLGVSSSVKDGNNDSFGLTGVASIGPVLAVSLMAVCSSKGQGSEVLVSQSSAVQSFASVFMHQLRNTAIGFGPLAAIIIVLQFTLMHFPKIKFKNIMLGVVYSFIGIVIFLTGVEYGFSSVGRQLGQIISSECSPVVTILTALVFGAIVVCAEPAVWVLTEQIEGVSAGRIKKRIVMIFLCAGVALAVALAMVRIIFNINYLYFAYCGVGLALLLTMCCPSLFTGMAFDSGGVASGPMSTSFLLSFAMGVSGSAEMSFGLVGMIAIAPLITIQILGIIFKISEKKGGSR